MKIVFFCQNPYAFGILEPLRNEALRRSFDVIWFVKGNLIDKFPFIKDNYTSDLQEIIAFESDVIFVPGNEVPYYLRGLKVQVFHGLAGEKKGHFRIRHYFDLYLTQGPYFTRKFKEFQKKHKNFNVVQTGWPKLDVYGSDKLKYKEDKNEILRSCNAFKIVLYAPTFSPSLTSAPYLKLEIEKLARNPKYCILIKFHDLMAQELIEVYKNIAAKYENVVFVQDKNIIKYLLMADILVSDTSSVVYEFLLLDKPVITYKNIAKKIQWDNLNTYILLEQKVEENLEQDIFKKEREFIISEYHPYTDGKSAVRMLDAAEEHINKYGVPAKRTLSFLRRRKIHKLFGKF